MTERMTGDDWIDWGALLSRVPEGERASLEQALTQFARPKPEGGDNPYMGQVTEEMQAVLERLEREGKAKPQGGVVLVRRELIPERFRRYL